MITALTSARSGAVWRVSPRQFATRAPSGGLHDGVRRRVPQRAARGAQVARTAPDPGSKTTFGSLAVAVTR